MSLIPKYLYDTHMENAPHTFDKRQLGGASPIGLVPGSAIAYKSGSSSELSDYNNIINSSIPIETGIDSEGNLYVSNDTNGKLSQYANSEVFNNNLIDNNSSIVVKQDKNGNLVVTEITKGYVTRDGLVINDDIANLKEKYGVDITVDEENLIHVDEIDIDTSGGIETTYDTIKDAVEKNDAENVNISAQDDNVKTKTVEIPLKHNTPVVKTISTNTNQNTITTTQSNKDDNSSNYFNIDKELFKNGMRVSLNIVPINRYVQSGGLTQSEFSNRLGYILGDSSSFLYQLFGPTKGLVFPYTPDIKMQSNVNYEEVEILHSNLNYNFYKNTPPPGVTITAEFTADTPENALYMLGAIWFFRALSKADFGKKSEYPGMPPPILYLNGYGKMYDNIPVVITGFNVDFDKNKHYVDLKMTDKMFKNFANIRSTEDKLLYDRIRGSLLDQWLPTDLTMSLQFKILPNMRKVKEKFNLKSYKSGILGNVMNGGSDSDSEFNGHGWTW